MATQHGQIESPDQARRTAALEGNGAGSHEPASEAVSLWILLARQYGILVFWLLICAGFTIATPAFLTKSNVLGILDHSAIVAILAAGEALVIMAAAIDLSIAPIAAIAGIVAAKLLKGDAAPIVALLGGLGVGAAAGWLNGFITVKGRITPLVATLGTFSTFTGLGLILTGGSPIYGQDGLNFLGLDRVLGVAMPVWIMLAVFGLLALAMSRTVWGVRLTAVGGNAEAARRAGVSVNRYLWGAFVVSGVCAALTGLIIFGTLSAAEPVMADALIFDAITAVALAGVLLTGGRGSIPKVLVGALILGTIENGFTLLNVPSYYQLVTTGGLLIAAVWIDGVLSRAIEKRRTMATTTTTDAVTA